MNLSKKEIEQSARAHKCRMKTQINQDKQTFSYCTSKRLFIEEPTKLKFLFKNVSKIHVTVPSTR